jgi:regulation of enolase protein 1 (concanavalin A-like superfamily)
MFNFDFNKAFWIYEPKQYEIKNNTLTINTQPNTDFWQRTYYGFRNDNAPALLFKTDERYFSFTIKTDFNSKKQFDQCGVIIYQNSDNWFKASIEYENEEYQRLGSVVTNNGFSDWATTDIDGNIKSTYYRLSRRESDFCIENSFDGKNFKQMRIFHLFEGDKEVNFGVYACSPIDSSFNAIFSEISISECLWTEHKNV